jgi:long-chain fatty acid transport protein
MIVARKVTDSLSVRALCVLSFSLLVSEQAAAVGFMINAPSQVTGMANAGSAVYDRSTAAITNNPAAMSLMEGAQIGGNITAVIPDWSVNEKWDCNAENDCASGNSASSTVIPTLGYVRPLTEQLTWGIGLGASAGQGMDYGKRFRSRPIVTDNEVQVIGLINSLSWRLNEKWTVGIGAGAIYGSFEQKQDLPSLSASAGDDIASVVDFVGLAQQCEGLPPPAQLICLQGAVDDSGLNPESAVETLSSIRSYLGGASGTRVKLEGDDIEAHVVVGLTYEPVAGHRFGVAYNYMSDFKFTGNAEINGQLLSDLEHQDVNDSLTWDMPERLVVSGSHEVTQSTILYWDFERVFFDDFESTDLNIEGYPEMIIDRNFKDANRYAVGSEYAFNDRLTLQLGLSFDESPVDDSDRMPDIPVDEIYKVALGAIYRVNDNLHVQGYALAEFLGDGEIEQLASIDGHKLGDSFNIDTDTRMYVLGFSFAYKF